MGNLLNQTLKPQGVESYMRLAHEKMVQDGVCMSEIKVVNGEVSICANNKEDVFLRNDIKESNNDTK